MFMESGVSMPHEEIESEQTEKDEVVPTPKKGLINSSIGWNVVIWNVRVTRADLYSPTGLLHTACILMFLCSSFLHVSVIYYMN